MATIAVPDMKTRPLILDGSKHNGRLTAEQILAAKIRLGIFRTGISYRYVDPEFEYYRNMFNLLEIPWCGYHVLYPSQPAWPQAENVKAIIGDDPGPCLVPVWNDLELAQGVSADQMADCCQEFGEELQKAFGGEKGIYSSYGFIDTFMPTFLPGQSWQNSYLWWLAQVLDDHTFHPGPYGLPMGLNAAQVVMIQNDWKGKIPGHQGDVDYSRWIRGEAEWQNFIGTSSPADPIEEPGDDMPDMVWNGKWKIVMKGALKKRTGPSTEYPVTGTDHDDYVYPGDVLTGYEKNPDTGWMRIEENAQVWISGSADYSTITKILEPVPHEPDPEPPEVHDLDWLIRIHEHPELHP